MPAIPPSDEPALPQLRRFRFDPHDPKVAHEVDADVNAVVDDAQAPSEAAPSETAVPASETADLKPAAAADLREADELLAALGGAAAPAPSTVAPSRPPVSGRPTSTDTRRGPVPGPQARPLRDATGPIAPRTGPNPVVELEPAKKRRSPWPFALVGVVAALVIGLVAWLVLTPSDEPNDPNDRATGESANTVSDWAAEICTELTDFQTAAMPLRAEVAKVTSGEQDDAAVDDLQRQAGKLLSTLATDLQSVGLPKQSEDASSAHTTIISAVNASATSVKSSGGSAVDTPEDASAAILSALDRPATIFQEAVSALSTTDRDAVTSQKNCAPLL